MNIPNYLKRIKYDPTPKVDFNTLHGLHVAHAMRVPFENFNVHLKQTISLDPDDLYTKIVDNHRGGYCYELNLLFADLLQAIGFEVHYLIARPIFGYTMPRPKTHMILRVVIESTSYLVDLGFGGAGLIAPIELAFDKPSHQFGETFQLVPHDDGFELQVKLAEHFVSLYSFGLEEQKRIDYDLANFYNQHSPESRFTQTVICAMPTLDGRIRLVDTHFSYHKDKQLHKQQVDAKTFQALLEEHFFMQDTTLAEKIFHAKAF